MSVSRKVTVPVGGLATNSTSSLLSLRGHYSSNAFSNPLRKRSAGKKDVLRSRSSVAQRFEGFA
jgi:hypothetical protein